MSREPIASCYMRPDGVLWRDTQLHVLVMTPGSAEDVSVLGGAGAILWRLLTTPATASALAEKIAESGMGRPDEEDVRACLQQLTRRRLLVSAPEMS